MPDNDTNSLDETTMITNDERVYEVSAKDLPIHCPMLTMSLWDSHPRVYLPIEQTGQAKCPYCGAEYRLKQ